MSEVKVTYVKRGDGATEVVTTQPDSGSYFIVVTKNYLNVYVEQDGMMTLPVGYDGEAYVEDVDDLIECLTVIRDQRIGMKSGVAQVLHNEPGSV